MLHMLNKIQTMENYEQRTHIETVSSNEVFISNIGVLIVNE